MPAKTRLTQRSSGAIIKAYGALAQLVARHIRIVKARGSTPLCSTRTILHKPYYFVGDFAVIAKRKNQKILCSLVLWNISHIRKSSKALHYKIILFLL